jgi:FlaG protein
MSDSRDVSIQPTQPVGRSSAVQPVRAEVPAGVSGFPKPRADEHDPAAATGGSLRAAYAQFVINPDTHDVVIRVRDSETDQVLSETPSPEVERMAKYLRDYANTLARHRAALRAAVLD